MGERQKSLAFTLVEDVEDLVILTDPASQGQGAFHLQAAEGSLASALS